MAKPATQVLDGTQERVVEASRHEVSRNEASRNVVLVVGASLFVALCARITIPLMPLTPVPLTVQNLGVLLVGLLLGSRRGFAALALYLMEGVIGLPVFNPLGPGGVAQLLGPTGGFLMVYPFVAFLAGFVFERGRRTFVRAATAGLLAEILLFAGGLAWLYAITHSLAKAAYLGLYWFLAAEVIKVMVAAAVAIRWRRGTQQ
jgi:biotin transport system substrate-specific component